MLSNRSSNQIVWRDESQQLDSSSPRLKLVGFCEKTEIGVCKTKRREWVDVVRGISITLMVVGHVVGGLLAAKVFGPNTRWQVFYDWKYVFNMPTLFMVSGLFIQHSLVKRGLAGFVAARARTLVYPQILWSIIAWVMVLVMYRYANNPSKPHFPWEIFYDVRAGRWTLATLFVCGIAIAVCRVVQVPSVVILIGITILSVFSHPGGTMVLNVTQVASLAWYGSWLALGMVGSSLILLLGSAGKWWMYPLISAAGFAVATILFMKGMNNIASQYVGATGGVVGEITLGIGLARMPRNFLVQALRYCGRRSLEIYMTSDVGMVVPRLVLMRILGVRDGWLLFAAGSIGGIGFPLLLVYVLDRFGIGYIFRFEPNPKKLNTVRISHETQEVTR